MSVEHRIKILLEEISETLLRSNRGASEVTLIAVSKKASLEQMMEAYGIGIRHFGESRLQIALAKRKHLPNDIVWHFIGPIQSNKASLIASSFSFVHSISSYKIAEIISRSSIENGRKCCCFIEVNLSKEASKQGFSKEEFLERKRELESLEGLSIQGLMTMAPHTKEEIPIRMCFKNLASLKGGYASLSMGMSEDFKVAIEEGSTHIRIGSYLFQKDL